VNCSAEKYIPSRRIVGSLTPTIDANFRNDCPGSSKISLDPFDYCKGPRGVFLRVTLPRWRTRTFVWLFWSTIFYHVINGWSRISKKSIYFRWWSSSAKANNCGSSLYLQYILCLVATTILSLWLFTRSIRLIRSPKWHLAEAQYGRKFKLKFVWILMTHSV